MLLRTLKMQLLLLILKRDKSILRLKQYGIKKEGINKSVTLGLLFIPVMLIVTFIVKYIIGVVTEANTVLGIVSFVESFSEEFFFRGILFIFLSTRKFWPCDLDGLMPISLSSPFISLAMIEVYHSLIK